MKTYINGHCIEQVLTNAVELTSEQYNALSTEQKNHGTYIITDAEAPSIEASNVSVDLGSGVTSDVQTILDSLDSKVIESRTPGTIDSDTTILSWKPGVYQIALQSPSQYLPTQWGTLIIAQTNSVYGCVIFINIYGNLYFRHYTKGDYTWHTAWRKVSISTSITKCDYGYTFPNKASEISSDNDKYTVPVDGIAAFTVVFGSGAYSQCSFSVNGITIFRDNLTSGSQSLEGLRNMFTIPVKAGDVLRISFYQTYGVNGAYVRILHS